MLSYLMRETLIDALAAGPPYQVLSKHIHAVSQMQILNELVRRGLITSDPTPVLTEAGIAEAKWFTKPAKRSDDDGGEG
jgi:hypothetical protein